MHTGRQRGTQSYHLPSFHQMSTENAIQYHFGNLLLKCPYKLMHLARCVLSTSSLHGGKRELLIIVYHFVGQQTSDIIV